MERKFYLELAAAGFRTPIGTHLVLHEHPNASRIMEDGAALGQVVQHAAERFRSPLALPLMDLTLESAAVMQQCGIQGEQAETFHFHEPPPQMKPLLTGRMTATCEGIRYIANETSLVPVGMAIGPFSLTTKLLADPITPVYLKGAGEVGAPEVRVLDAVLALSTEVVLAYVRAQLDAGAKAMIICEPAANKMFFSPNQLARSYAHFDELVMAPNRRIRELLSAHGADLVFHNCGEVIDSMLLRFTQLDPAILSLGSSRKLWEDAALVPKTTVLYGNLPTKRFYSDALITVEEVVRLTRELIERMRDARHPFVLGSECDVLSVPGHEATITAKVNAFLEATAPRMGGTTTFSKPVLPLAG